MPFLLYKQNLTKLLCFI